MSTLIRPAIPSDLRALLDLSRRTIGASYRSFLGDEAVNAFLGGSVADRYVTENLDRCWVLVRNGHIVGYAVCKENLIDLMMIDPPFHRQGLGTRLLQHVEKVLGGRHEELRLESFEANEPANAFYRKNGWLQVDRYFDQDSGVNKIVLRKTTRAPEFGVQ